VPVYVISGLRRQVDENCARLGYYEACSDNSLPTFLDNLLVLSSMVHNLSTSNLLYFNLLGAFVVVVVVVVGRQYDIYMWISKGVF
jgi:hypothetical protein